MKPNLVQTLKKLVNENSHTHNKEGVNKVGRMFVDLLEEVDLEWQITPNHTKGDLFWGKSKNWDESKPVILLSGHLDTVFPKNWDIHVEGDRFYGPGTMDMKAGDLVIVEVLKELENQGKLENIMVLFTPDEEDGMAHLNDQYKIYKMADFVFVFEEGSRTIEGKLESKTRSVVYARKAVSFYEFVFKGVGGHHAKHTKKSQRHSAINEMARKVLELEKLANYEKGTLVNVGLVTGGTSPNSLAEECKVNVDIRYGSREEVERVEDDLKRLLKPVDPKVQILEDHYLFYPSMEATEKNKNFAEEVVKIGRNLGLDIIPEFRSSGSEANWISEANPDAVILDGFGVVGAGDHSSQEFFLMDSFQDSIDLTIKTIERAFEYGK